MPRESDHDLNPSHDYILIGYLSFIISCDSSLALELSIFRSLMLVRMDGSIISEVQSAGLDMIDNGIFL